MLGTTIALARCHGFDGSSCWCKEATGPSVPARSPPSTSLSPMPSACVALWWGAAAFLTGTHCIKVGVNSVSFFWVPFCPYSFLNSTFLFYYYLPKPWWLRFNTRQKDINLQKFFHPLPQLLEIQPVYWITSSIPLILLLLFFVPWLIQMLGKRSEFYSPEPQYFELCEVFM